MKKLVIIGAGGHGKVIADIAFKNQYTDIVFLDDNKNIYECAGLPVKGTVEKAKDYIDWDFIIAIGDSDKRKAIFEKIEKTNFNIVSLIHPNAVISRRVDIGKGTVVMAGCVINSDTMIGKACIINSCASVDHDGKIQDFSHISVGAHLAGNVFVGKNTWIGAGAIVLNNLSICNDTIIGAGAVVTHCIENKGVYIGIPARPVED